ncbi:MAG TPA: methyltransferase domain-containing protein [Solirubrobacteraceae bacterium]|nr:methyltransferase domain-containing protein [Solirubrobacteraceae bacterium]
MHDRDFYEAAWDSLPPGLEPSEIRLRAAFLREQLASLTVGARVLDVGCGEGVFTALLATMGADVLGADVAEEPLRRARVAHPQLRFELMPVDGAWPFEDACFDAVWAGEVIEHLADTAAWLSELRRVLRSGGLLLLSTPDHGLLTRLASAVSHRRFAARFDPRGQHLRFYERTTLSHLIQDFGFEQIRVRGAGGPPGPRRVRLARAVRARF